MDTSTTYIIENCNNLTATELASHLKRDVSSIRNTLKRLNISAKKHKFNNIEILLDQTNVSAYWIGFLLADGWVSGNTSIALELGSKDKEHIEKYAKYVGAKVGKYVRNTNFKKNYTYFNVTTRNCEVVPKICSKYDINERKTTNPPKLSLYNITDDQWISLFIGFVDGDGCIYRTKTGYNKINIQIHPSWKNNLEFLNKRIHDILNQSSRAKVLNINNGTVALCISKESTIQCLLECVQRYNLPILTRKWSKITPSLYIPPTH